MKIKVMNKEKIFKGFCYINVYIKVQCTCPLWAWPFVTPGTSFEQT